MIHGDVSADLLRTIFMPRAALHDGAVIIRDDRIVAAGALLPLAETSIHTERFGTRHRAALGITEQTDAVVVVVSEENGQISLVERARIVRNLTEGGLAARSRVCSTRPVAGGLHGLARSRERDGWPVAPDPRALGASSVGRRRPSRRRPPQYRTRAPERPPSPRPGMPRPHRRPRRSVRQSTWRTRVGRREEGRRGKRHESGSPRERSPATDDRAAVVVDPPNRLDPEAANSVAADPADVATDEPASATTDADCPADRDAGPQARR